MRVGLLLIDDTDLNVLFYVGQSSVFDCVFLAHQGRKCSNGCGNHYVHAEEKFGVFRDQPILTSRTGFSFVITGRCGKHRSRPMINFVSNCTSDLPTNFRNKVSLEMNNGCIFVNSTFCSLDLTYGNGNLDTAIRSRRGHRKKMPLTELEEDRKIYTKSIKLLINFRGSRWFTN